MKKQEMEMEKAMKNYYETEFTETAAEMPEYPDKDAMEEMAAIAEAEAAEMEEADREFEAARAAFEAEEQEAAEQEEARQYEALVFSRFCETQDKIEDDLRREMERTAGKYFNHVATSGA